MAANVRGSVILYFRDAFAPRTDALLAVRANQKEHRPKMSGLETRRPANYAVSCLVGRGDIYYATYGITTPPVRRNFHSEKSPVALWPF